MKKITFYLLLLAVTVSSCKKERLEAKTDFQINAEIDKKLSPDNIVNLSKDELTLLAKQKYEVLYRIKTNNPGITFERLYPDIKEPIFYKGGDCIGQFNSQRVRCNITYLGDAFYSVGSGFLVGWVFPPAGIGIGAAGIIKDTYDYNTCIQTAIQTRDNCLKK